MNLSSVFLRSAIEKRHKRPDSWRASLVLQGASLVLLTAVLAWVFSGGKVWLLLAAIMAATCAFWVIQKPHWGVLVILATWFVEIDAIGIRYFSVPYLVSAVLLIPLAMSIMRDRRIWVLRAPQIQIFLAIGGLFLLSTWWSDLKYPVTLMPELDETFRKLQLFFTRLIFVVFFLYFITNLQRIKLVVCVTLALIVFTAMSGIAPLLTGGTLARAAAGFSLAENPNRFAYICLFGTSLLWFYRSYAQRPRWNFFILLLLFLLPVTALATGSRSGFLQTAALAALILKEQEGWSPARRLRSIFLLGCVGILVLVIVPAANLARITSFDPSEHTRGQKSLQHRMTKLVHGFGMITSDPVLGVGIGNYRWIAKVRYGGSGDPHNSYVWALSTGGVGVLALYLILFYSTYKKLRELERAGPRELLWLSKGLRINLILFLIFSTFADFWLSDFLYLIVALVIAMTYLEHRHIKRSVSSPLLPAGRDH